MSPALSSTLPPALSPTRSPAHPRVARLVRGAYAASTVLIAAAFVSGGAAYLAGAEVPLRGMAALGYPAYFVVLLGVWKVAGGLVLLAPRLPRLKEWAYAGITFDLTGAAVSQAASGAPAAKVLVPLGLLAVAAASWALRPSDRRLAGGTRVPVEG